MQVSDIKALVSVLPQLEQQALLACATPPWFDEAMMDVLLADHGCGASGLATVRAHLDLMPYGTLPGCYVLDTAQRQGLLSLLQAEFEDFYRVFHRRAVAYFVRKVQFSQAEERRVYEDALMSLLDTLFRRYMSIHEVLELASVLAAAAAPLDRPEHRHLLAYYRACTDNERGDYDSAESIFAALLAEPGLHDQLRARALTALGINLNYRDQYDKAIDAYRQSREAYVRLGDRLGQAKALSNVGIIHSQLGRYEEAIAVLEESYGLAVQIGDLIQSGRAVNELGLAAKELGRWDAALDYYRQALDIWRELGNRVSQGRVYNNLGEVYYLTGRWDEAEFHFERALSIALDPEVEDKRQAADMLHNLGLLCFSRGQFEAAQARYKEALLLSRQIESSAAISLVYQRLGQLWETQGHLRKAYRTYRQAIEVIEAMRGRVERQETKISLFGTRQQPYEAMVLLCWKLGWFARAFHYAERARARAFLDLLAQLTPRAKEKDEATAVGADQAEEPLNLRQVCRGLPVDTALVAYFTTGVLDWGDGIIQNLPAEARSLRACLLPPARTLAFVITRTGLVEHRDLAIDPNALRPSPTDDPARDPRLLDDRKLRRLYDLLLAPVWDQVQDKRVLYVMPHGPLHYLPFGALCRPDGRRLVHADHPRLAHAPSATVLLRHCCGSPSTASRSCLALGYNGQGPTALRHAEGEAQAIARLWNGKAWAGDGPKKTLLQQAAGGYRVLHLACHGQFNPRDALGSSLTLGAEDRLTAAEIIEHLRLDADLVILSACHSGVSHIARGDELVGFIRAFMSAGASSLVVTQWQVADVSTRIVMERFHQNLIAGMSWAEGLQRAQIYLQGLTLQGLRRIMAAYGQSEAEIESQVQELRVAHGEAAGAQSIEDTQVFAHPRYWAPFILVGRA
jgi:CHAT domain-containing protein/tetratricopeptide (TPR) repeat protein